MSLNLNPWLALLLGILIGWLLEWLLELWFFRRRRLECQSRLSQVEADLRTREIELGNARAHADSLQADLTALSSVRRLDVKAEAPAFKAPDVKVEAPQVEVNPPQVKLPEVGVAAAAGAGLAGLAAKITGEGPRVEVTAPTAELPKVEVAAPEIEAPTATLPAVELPHVAVETPKIAARLPEVTAPTVQVELPEAALPAVELPAISAELPAASVAAPRVELPEAGLAAVAGLGVTGLTGKFEGEAPEVETRLAGAHVEMPGIAIEAPEVVAPAVSAELPAVGLPKVELSEAGLAAVAGAGLAGVAGKLTAETPKVELPKVEVPQVELTAPKVELPKVEAELPAVELPTVELPKVELPEVELAAVAGAGLAGLAGKLTADTPAIELPAVELPKVEVELPKVEIAAPKVELPEVGLAAVTGIGLAGLGGKLTAEAPVVEAPAVEATLAGATVEMPKIEIETPKLEAERSVNWTAAPAEPAAPRAEVHWPEVGSTVAEVGATLPEVQPLAAEIKAPSIGAELPAVAVAAGAAMGARLPDVAVEVTQPPAASPAIAGDDLEIIEGIGPVYAAKLHAAGITTCAQLAATDEARLGQIIAAPAWRKTNYADWLAQARLAAAGNEEGLTAFQTELFSRQGNNLDLISGIGSKTADVLKGAGITSFAALAEATPEKLAAIVKKAGVRGGEYQTWIAEAGQRAAGKRVPRVRKIRAAAHVSSCPQDLSKLHGIGTVYEQKLYAAGIGTFWQLSQADATNLAGILGIKDFQKVDLAEIKAAAQKMAEETDTVGLSWDGSQPDDFEPLGGIGEVYEGRLYDAGICTYRALAATTVERLAEICKAPAWRMPDYAGWIAQAKVRLAEGK
ncbi:MAG: helix-hairpin-helix domain-containing protein [Chloroflexi bacterium]|nr:helix-hairpin-helix domain-containing protein [Chloroflexota bacterium]